MVKGKSHILYIEDNEYNQRLIRKILEPGGYQLSQALDGIQGIKHAAELNPDLILMDMDLPYLDGINVATKLKSIESLEDVPIVALLSKNSKQDRERSLVAGCCGYIEKPIDAANLAERIETYLSGKRENVGSADRTKILRGFHVDLVDQLQNKIEELEETNRELRLSKEELQLAYEQAKNWNEEQQRLNRLKENIVAITSHELRTPLSLASGYLDLMAEGLLGELNEEQNRVTQISRQSLTKMGELIDKITDLNRLALKKFPMELGQHDLNAVFLRVREDMALFMKIRDLHFEAHLSKEPLVVVADDAILNQVFSNLLRNAICFTPNGGVIQAYSWLEGDKAYFRLEDSGIGLREEDFERIFDEFYQVTDVTHHKTGEFEHMTRGIGVGLALSKGVLGKLGGKIWAQSPGLDKGSSFSFYLPLAKSQ